RSCADRSAQGEHHGTDQGARSCRQVGPGVRSDHRVRWCQPTRTALHATRGCCWTDLHPEGAVEACWEAGAPVSTRDVNKAIRNALRFDAQLLSLGSTGVFDSSAPESQDLPVVVFTKVGGDHSYTLGGPAWQTHTFDIKGISQTTKDLAEQLDNRIAAILNLTKPTLDNGTVLDFRRVADISYVERNSGTTYYHVGGTYEVMATNG